MKKHRFLSIALITILALLIPTTSVLATTTQGLTPGFWKQAKHFEPWRDNPGWSDTLLPFDPDTTLFDDAADYIDTLSPLWTFDPVTNGIPGLTLLDALKLHGGGENAFLRHAAAAILNSTCGINYASPEYVAKWIYFAYNDETVGDPMGLGDTYSMEDVKDKFEELNEVGL